MSTSRDALALHGAGRTADALVLLFNAVAASASSPRTPQAGEDRQTLAGLLEGVSLDSGNEVIERVLLALLNDPAVDPQQLARASLGLIVASPEFAALDTWSTVTADGNSDDGIELARVAPCIQALLQLPLVRALLPRVVLSEARFERTVTFARGALLRMISGDTPAQAWHWDGVHLLAQSAFNGEYAWRERDDERAFILAAGSSLSAWLAAQRSGTSEPANGEAAADAIAPILLLYAMYRRLSLLSACEHLATLPVEAWGPSSAFVGPTLAQHVGARLEERALADSMPSLSLADHAAGSETSARVRAMYEAHPYPRWTAIGTPRLTSVAHLVRELAGRSGPPESLRLLVAGCGTGRQAAHTARSFPGSRVLALDLSRSSLGYAARMARHLGIDTVDFMHGDILALDALQEQFGVVFCSGVLHHMADPRAGWAQLVQRLHPRGVMKVALYSETARRAVTAAREVIDGAAQALDGGDDSVRRCRELLLALPAGHPARAVTDSTDFYSLSGCRDLVMHVQERTYTMPALAAELDALELRFLGFQLPANVQQAFVREHSAPGATRSLDAWASFEQRHPGTFWGMYQFFVEKRVASE